MIYNEKMTGTKRSRPELIKLLDRMIEGDTAGQAPFILMSAIAQFECDVIADRASGRLKLARARGRGQAQDES